MQQPMARFPAPRPVPTGDRPDEAGPGSDDTAILHKSLAVLVADGYNGATDPPSLRRLVVEVARCDRQVEPDRSRDAVDHGQVGQEIDLFSSLDAPRTEYSRPSWGQVHHPDDDVVDERRHISRRSVRVRFMRSASSNYG